MVNSVFVFGAVKDYRISIIYYLSANNAALRNKNEDWLA